MKTSTKTYEQALEKLENYLRVHRKRQTEERQWLLQQICALPQPFTIDQLVEAAAERGIVRATVYNTLDVFIAAQILNAIERHAGKGATAYEIMLGRQNRMQFICRNCGRISDLHDRTISNMISTHKYPNYTMKRYSLFVYGECKACRVRKKK